MKIFKTSMWILFAIIGFPYILFGSLCIRYNLYFEVFSSIHKIWH